MGNDAAADFAAELDGHRRWAVVKAALTHATKAGPTLDSDDAAVAIAAAEVVAHGLGRPTQDDVSTESIQRFVARTRRPSERLAGLASRAVAVAASEDGELRSSGPRLVRASGATPSGASSRTSASASQRCPRSLGAQ